MNSDTLDPEVIKLLLIEDDSEIAEVVYRGLQSAGYRVDLAADGNKGLQIALNNSHAALILDLMLPGLDGFNICRELRAAGVSVPILMLTARDAVHDRVKGLEHGADDYLVKPFEFAELLARVRALLRREKSHRAKVLKIAYLSIDTEGRQVWVDGKRVNLNQREYDLLEALAQNEGRILTRDAIQDRVWNNEESYSNVVDVQVRRLRKKIESHGLPSLIHTIRGLGYTLRRPDQENP